MVAITDENENIVNKYAYDTFGAVLDSVEGISNPFKYVGAYGVMDEGNGLLYMRARYYDPEVGRFISKDPIGLAGGDVNLYGYAGQNPVNYIDPEGREQKIIGSLIGPNGESVPMVYDTETGQYTIGFPPEKTTDSRRDRAIALTPAKHIADFIFSLVSPVEITFINSPIYNAPFESINPRNYLLRNADACEKRK